MPFLNYYKYMVLWKFCWLLCSLSLGAFCAWSYRLVDLRVVHPIAGQPSGIFSQNSQIWNWCINWWELSETCSLLFHVFFFQFIFVLPARYVCMRNFTGKSKLTQVFYRTKWQLNLTNIWNILTLIKQGRLSMLTLKLCRGIDKGRFLLGAN